MDIPIEIPFLESHPGFNLEFEVIVFRNGGYVYRNVNSKSNTKEWVLVGFPYQLAQSAKITDWFEESINKIPNKCTCDLHSVIMVTGCQCGGQ